ncbi:efflux transporter outer membrane subunit [Rhodoferax saidenbachensis]|uniref:NodT family efflux transporter outer membrane factor (OMF) lipoprotein n=1 Tax=Rhodoferax saidenbachensis TaxID=1484693 RepID=A0ABU1ZSW7_9BURK|nr:efflux transporter outer membrane subunit [Rhodoferax saidenbachensis]MDR7308639.1 NodT family efflux transporter outer membrane factor (OMF) lipoprotein [Rhodoferax saidenbachensis]
MTALVLAVLSLSACSTLLPGKPVAPANAVAVPAAWTATTAAAASVAATPTALADWWSRFNDPQLTGLVTQALLANTDVQTAQAALQQSRALRDAKVAALGPSIGASASAQRSFSGTGSSGSAGNSFSAGFDASWEPDIFGGKHNAAEATQADADAAQTSLANVRVSVAAEVAVAYIELRGLQAQVAIAQSNLQSQTETLQITQWRAQAGLTTSLEVEQARTSVAQTAAQVPALQASVSKTLHSLAVLTGQAPAALNNTLSATQPVPQAPPDLALSLPVDTLRQRPDVRAAELKVTAALARVSEAEAARYPSFSLSTTLGLKALTLGALTDGASLVSALLASVSAPLFDGGAAKAQVRAQEAALAQTHVAYQATVLTALKDVEDALVALQGDRSRLVELQTAADAASNAALLASQRYQSGLIDFQTVLTTQRTLLGAQDNVASTVASVSADHVRLYKALGGGWN